MIPAARIQATTELLHNIQIAPIPMDGVSGDYFRSRRYIGSKDRADIVERVYAIVRHYGRLNWWCKKLDIEADARHLVLLFLRLVEGRSISDISTLYDGSQYGPKPLDPSEQALLNDLKAADIEPDDMPNDVRHECPDDHAVRVHAAYPNDFADLMNSMMESAPLDLRVNTVKCDRAGAMKSLSKDQVESDPTPFAPYGIRLRAKTFLSATNAFRHGLVDIQDEGSQLIAHVCGAEPRMQVLDYCAGGGGKTLALAASMENKGRIVAMDLEAARLEKSRLRFRRAGIADIVEVRPLSDEKNRKWLRRQKETFDVTLVDAPCSGSGTWRRNPDGRWRNFGPSLDELIKTQAEILDRVAGTVKPGGRLVYATCSIFLDENENQVDAFLKLHPEFRVLPVPQLWADGTPCPVTGPYLRLAPHTHQTDGFFAAVLIRAND